MVSPPWAPSPWTGRARRWKPPSATLGEGTWLVSLKVDHAKFETGRTPPPDQDAESEYNQYWLATLGYGFKPWLTAYVTQPYNVKVDEPDGQDSRGLADLSVGAAIGFKYDDGFLLTPANESLDDLMDWHFSAMAGMTLPSGNPNKRLQGGIIDPGKSTRLRQACLQLRPDRHPAIHGAGHLRRSRPPRPGSGNTPTTTATA
jgi:hypothetical protein